MDEFEEVHIGLGPRLLPQDRRRANQEFVLDRVLRRVAAAIESSAKSANLAADDYGVSAPHNVICVSGARGTGKTSVLITIADELRKLEGALVADTIYPDQLDPRYPILPVAVHAIERALASQVPDAWAQAEKRPGGRYRDPLWSLSIPETFDVVSRDSLNAGEWNRKIFDLMSSPVDSVRDFRRWLNETLDAVGLDLVVITIDDADIAIEKAEEVIDLLRTYLTDPRIVSIVATDLKSLERRLRNLRLEILPNVATSGSDGGTPFLMFGMSPDRYRETEAEAEGAYVEALLTKVLPPASRYHLTPLPPEERLNSPFAVSNHVSPPLHEVMRNLDSKAPASGVLIAPLLTKHPEVLSSNMRVFSNQYVMLREVATEYQSLGGPGDNVREPSPPYSLTQDTGGLSIPPPDTPDEVAWDRLTMSVMRCLMSTTKFGGVSSYASDTFGVHLDAMQSMTEFANFVLSRVSVSGTRDFRLTYRVAEFQLREEETCGLLDLVTDWVGCRGVPRGRVFDLMATEWVNSVFRRVRLPTGLKRALKPKEVAQLDPTFHLVSGAQPSLTVSVDGDRVAPVFIRDSNGLGRYIHRVANMPRLNLFEQHAKDYLLSSDRSSGPTQQEIESALYRAMGILGIQTLFHIDAVLIEILADGVPERGVQLQSTNFRGDAEFPWIITENRGVVRSLTDVLRKTGDDDEASLAAMTYIADLPMQLVLDACVDPDLGTQIVELGSALGQWVGRLEAKGWVDASQSGGLSCELTTAALKESGSPFVALKRDYPQISWQRRWEAFNRFHSQVAGPWESYTWDPQNGPPPKWANRVVPIARRISGREAKRKKETEA